MARIFGRIAAAVLMTVALVGFGATQAQAATRTIWVSLEGVPASPNSKAIAYHFHTWGESRVTINATGPSGLTSGGTRVGNRPDGGIFQWRAQTLTAYSGANGSVSFIVPEDTWFTISLQKIWAGGTDASFAGVVYITDL